MKSYEALLSQVDPKWREAFKLFVENAEADEAFLDYLAKNPECERAVDQAIQLEAESLGDLSTLLSESMSRSPEVVSRNMANAIRTALEMEPEAREEMMAATADRLEAAVDANEAAGVFSEMASRMRR